ncbi:DnaJ-like protein subfamily C member 10 [Aphelenchoides avenae]|nr:DnaJ-like protein subfamily C member 10 [Aphelenchus avenae]
MIAQFALISLLILSSTWAGEDFYELLGVARDADDRTIRKAFKKIAIQKHPDKNPDDPDAHSTFVRINRAYEVLKDEELRKKYDQWGEEGLKDNFQGGQQYQSWQFYRDNFGIYDDDQEIVTLSRSDFEQMVVDSGDLWFVNFYSTYCSHCHELAPTWREFAREMDGVVRIGAVNCAEDPALCQSQNVMGYPSLVAYPERLFFRGPRDLKHLTDFIMTKLTAEVHKVTFKNYESLSKEWTRYADKAWVLDFCDDDEQCLSKENRRKLASMLQGIANVGTVRCVEHQRDLLCKRLQGSGVAYFPPGKIQKEALEELSSFDHKELYKEVIRLLPQWPELTDDEYEQLTGGFGVASPTSLTLVHFADEASADDDVPTMEYKKLPAMFSDIRFHIARCSKLDDACSRMHFGKLPKFALFKANGGYEIYYEKKTAVHDIANFIRQSRDSELISFTDELYQRARNSGEMWLIDYFTPWCPPCLRLIPELRDMPNEVNGVRLRVGVINCDVYKHICNNAGVSSYPTTILYRGGQEWRSVGFHNTDHITEFIEVCCFSRYFIIVSCLQESLSPSVDVLTPELFEERVNSRPSGHLYIVDFFAPWCGPCQQLAPEYRKVARSMKTLSDAVGFGTMDCDAHRWFCQQNGITSYPTILLYPADPNNRHFDYPSNWWRDHGSMQHWITQFLPSLVEDLNQDFYHRVLGSTDPWLVDFFAPWCGHCVQFAPTYERIAKALEGRVKVAKVDCDKWPGVCQSVGVRAYPSVRFYAGSAVEGTRQDHSGAPIQSQDYNGVLQLVENELRRRHRRLTDEL